MKEQQPLFSGYGEPSERKTRSKPEFQEINLHPPWVLLIHHRDPPRAHILDSVAPPTKENSRLAVCGAKGGLLRVEGTPLVPICAVCRKITGH